MGQGYEMVSLGLTFAGGIVAFVLGGWLLDRWLRLTPVFTVSGTVVGSVLSFYYVYVKLIADAAREKKERKP